MLIWIELSVVAVITAAVLASSFILLKPEHVDHDPTRVRIGAALQGLILGLLVGFVILPLRFAFFVPDPHIVADAPKPPSGGLASLSILPFFALLIVVRRGLLARAPVIGVYLRAYRKAALKQQISSAQSALSRLAAIDSDDRRKERAT
ncbi:MAG: hypothetical protein ACOYM8_18880 [Caulobacterales bacterium]|jgi:hypothetical protein